MTAMGVVRVEFMVDPPWPLRSVCLDPELLTQVQPSWELSSSESLDLEPGLRVEVTASRSSLVPPETVVSVAAAH